MKLRFVHRRRAISTVLTTIIILVASVVLASGVVLYGTSLFQTSTQQEAISIAGVKAWVHATETDGLSWGAFAVRNSGDKILSVNKISIRGTDVPFTQWFPDTTVTSNILQQPMNFTGWSGTNGLLLNTTTTDSECGGTKDMELNIAPNEDFCANAASGPVGLEPGKGAIIYFKLNNGTLTSIDSGVSTSVGVFAGITGAPISITVASKT